MTTFYCIAPATLEDILADVYVDCLQIATARPAAAAIVDRLYDALTPANEGPVVYNERLLRGVFGRLSDWLRPRIHDGVQLARVRDVLLERLTDEFYMETHA